MITNGIPRNTNAREQIRLSPCVRAARSRMQPMIAAGRMIRRHRANIVTFFRHRITNATSESINAKIQWIKYTARGFRNRDNFKTAIYFHCGGLDLAPTK